MWPEYFVNVHEQSPRVTLSPFASLRGNSAKGLSRAAARCFASLSMTGLDLAVPAPYSRDVYVICWLLMMLFCEVAVLHDTNTCCRMEDTMPSLDQARLHLMHRYWNAANYLTVGQIYLQSNPLLREPLRPEHIKPRLLGHGGTTAGLSFIYMHLNRLIRERDAQIIYLAGPGHGGPALVANVYLEGTYSEIFPEVGQDADGMHRLFRQFSTPGGIPSHVSVTTPGSIHERAELGYVLTHAFGAAFDNPDLIPPAVFALG